MKRVLFAAAAEDELNLARSAYQSLFHSFKGLDSSNLETDFLLTGTGSTSTAYTLAKTLTFLNLKYDLIINIGFAATFSPDYPIGSVVRVSKEVFDSPVLNLDTFPFREGFLYSSFLDFEIEDFLSDFPSVSGITVQNVIETKERFELLESRFHPDVESMEGAAFFFTAIQEKVAFLELRSISNNVMEMDKSKWNISLASANLREACKGLMKVLSY